MKSAISVKSFARLPQRTLWSHQVTAVRETLAHLRAGHATLLVSPTGSGKTVMAAEISRKFKNVLLVGHRREIVDQARAIGIHAMTIQKALRRGPRRVDLLIIDEAHRSAAATYRQLMERYSKSARLGLTATPLRTDGQGLCDAFSALVVSSSMAELVEAGHLVPFRAFEGKEEDLSQLAHMRRIGGDFATRELSTLMNRPRLVGNVVREYKKNALGRKAVVFAVSVDHSKALEAEFVSSGIRAAHIDGRASETTRANALRDLADGKLDVLCNVNLFTEGWDCPSVSCVIMARPTASLTLYLQSVGRGMRTFTGKRDLIVLDHAGNIARHGRPDEIREWKLESDKQKRKREAEVSELERLYALGFDSVEAELEEKRRLHALTYSATTVRGMLSQLLDRSSMSTFLKSFGVLIHSGSGSSSRYLRSDIDRLCSLVSLSSSPSQAAELLNVNPSKLSQILRSKGLLAISGSPTMRPRYATDQLRALAESISESYDAGQVDILMARFKPFKWKKEISPLLAWRGKHVYSKVKTDDLVARLSQTCISSSAKRSLRVNGAQLFSLCRKNGIRPAMGSGLSTRYLKSDIARLRLILSAETSGRPCSICGKPMRNPTSKQLAHGGACKAERKRRYSRDYQKRISS